MRSLLILALVCILAPLTRAESSIRQVDFKNFTYPFKDSLLGHGELKWLSVKGKSGPRLRTTSLKNGEDRTKDSSFQMDGKEYAQYSGFNLQSVTYANLMGNGGEVAIVVLRYLTGGTQNTNYVYFYTMENGKLKLLAYCHTGDRADFGLRKVYAQRDQLVFELFDPNRRQGDCCSNGIIRMFYHWNGIRFAATRLSEHIALNEQDD